VTLADARPYVGQSVPRREDRRLLLGETTFLDDLALPGMLWVSLVRSPYANARIVSVDTSAALELEGVVAAFSGQELMDEWAATLPCVWRVSDDIRMPPHWPVTPDKARHVGDGVAVVIATSRVVAKDAAELVVVEYDPGNAVTDVLEAGRPDSPLVHDEYSDNKCYTWRLSSGDLDRVFADAPITVSERYRQQRLIIAAMEPRGVMVQPGPGGEYTLWSSTQIPHILRTTMAETTGIPEARLRIIAPDVGGGFGSKVQVYPEEALLLGLARRLGHPLKWIAERSEDHVTTHHARDMVQDVELAATDEGRILGMRVRLTAAMGAYLGINGPGIPLLGAQIYTGCYSIPEYECVVDGFFTHNTMTDAYRGAGRPEAAYGIERCIEALARRLEKDPLDVRRLNFVNRFPYKMASGLTIDIGDFHGCLEKLEGMLDLPSSRAEQQRRRDAGESRVLGVGLSTYIEMAGLAPSRILGSSPELSPSGGSYRTGGWEAGTVRFLPTGTVQVVTGLSPHGQGTATSLAQIVADEFGISPDDIEVIHGDTAASSMGMDTYGSRGIVVGGVAVHLAARRVVAKAKRIAAHRMEAAEEDLVYEPGRFVVRGTSSEVSLKEIGMAAWQAHDLPEGEEPGLEATSVFDPTNFSWPSGAYAAVVDVDTETGSVDLLRFAAVDDVGTIINPMLVEGQIHGALTQGIAQALWEEALYDEGGNPLTASLMDYMVPTAEEVPAFEVDHVVTRSPENSLGAKGAGETGTVGAPPAVVNAVLDALSPHGVTTLDMPLTPERVWNAIKAAEEANT
jgi:aerobic carbon-monoxide dehydrogenase large subunit